MDIWNDFVIRHEGINYISDENFYELCTLIKDRKTKYNVVEIYSVLFGKTLEFHIGTNEKMLKRLKLPMYKHNANFSYVEGNKFFDQKNKGSRMIPCLSLGTGNVQKILKSIIAYWKDNGYTIKNVYVTRETGNTKKGYRYYNVEE